MALEILSPIPVAFDRREDGRAPRFGALEVCRHVVDVNQNTVDHVRDVVPAERNLAFLAVTLRAVVVERRGADHDAPPPGVELAVGEPAVLAPSILLPKPDRPPQPVHGRGS